MEDTMDIFDPNYYGMFSDQGNMMIANLVDRAREQDWSWQEVQAELERVSDMPGTSEATDTEVREAVFCKLGFHNMDVNFY